MVTLPGLWFLMLTFVLIRLFVYCESSRQTTCIWPKPSFVNLSQSFVTIQAEIYKFDLGGSPNVTHYMLELMISIAFSNLQAECGNAAIELGQKEIFITIQVKSSDLSLTWETSEKYVLYIVDISEKQLNVHIFADTVYGARHALETFTQLSIAVYSERNECTISIMSNVEIKDEPAFKHRGLLLDTARHFFKVESIKRTLVGMAASKLNVFHWHITDSQSFPLESVRVPQLSRYGAFNASQVYTKSDIQDIIMFAIVRGIRVMLEVDGPAHSFAGWTWKELNDSSISEESKIQDFYYFSDKAKAFQCNKNSQLNVLNPSVYEILRSLYRDIAEYLPKPTLFHMGGDEVNFDCWLINHAYDIEEGYTPTNEDFYGLWAIYHNRTLAIWDEEYLATGGMEQQSVMLWSSDLTNPNHIKNYLNPTRYVIELWNREEDASSLMDKGYRCVTASSDWYLDHGFWGDTEYTTWEQMYLHVIPSDSNMLGGEVCMWTEAVDETSLDERIWPRASAFAERMWSNPKSTSEIKEVQSRLECHKSLLITRGVKFKARSMRNSKHSLIECVSGNHLCDFFLNLYKNKLL